MILTIPDMFRRRKWFWQYGTCFGDSCLFEVVLCLVQCRRALQYTYALAYYLEDGPKRQLVCEWNVFSTAWNTFFIRTESFFFILNLQFEHLQADLESGIENLSFSIERAETVGVADLQALMRSSEFRRKALFKDAKLLVSPLSHPEKTHHVMARGTWTTRLRNTIFFKSFFLLLVTKHVICQVALFVCVLCHLQSKFFRFSSVVRWDDFIVLNLEETRVPCHAVALHMETQTLFFNFEWNEKKTRRRILSPPNLITVKVSKLYFKEHIRMETSDDDHQCAKNINSINQSISWLNQGTNARQKWQN